MSPAKVGLETLKCNKQTGKRQVIPKRQPAYTDKANCNGQN